MTGLCPEPRPTRTGRKVRSLTCAECENDCLEFKMVQEAKNDRAVPGATPYPDRTKSPVLDLCGMRK